MSMNMFLEKESDPVVWRGPMISSAIKQFYSDVDWGDLIICWSTCRRELLTRR